MKPQELNLGSEIFNDLREKFDVAINALIRNLIKKDLSEGSMSVRIKTELDRHTNDETGEVELMPRFEPKINIKIGAKGDIDCNTAEGFILKERPDGSHVIGTNQISMDELMDDRKGA